MLSTVSRQRRGFLQASSFPINGFPCGTGRRSAHVFVTPTGEPNLYSRILEQRHSLSERLLGSAVLIVVPRIFRGLIRASCGSVYSACRRRRHNSQAKLGTDVPLQAFHIETERP